MIAKYEANYLQWQEKNLDLALTALKTEYVRKSQSEMAQVWRSLEDDMRTRLLNEAIKTFMREAYKSVKLLSSPSICAKMIEVFEEAVFDATQKYDWL